MTGFTHQQIVDISDTAPFNRWVGLSVTRAASGQCVLEMPWRSDFGQYAGFLHAGVVAALLDTSCGFAAWRGDYLANFYKLFGPCGR